MIVKNEAHVIERCLGSVRPWIDHWTIIDTGSTDRTQIRIRELMKDIPGSLYERPWINFAINRSESIAAASPFSDYLLLIDADDTLEVESKFAFPLLSRDAYTLTVHDAGHLYRRLHIIRTSLPWRYEGVLHEYLECSKPYNSGHIDGLRYMRVGGGARSLDANKFRRDAEVLSEALKREPNNARYWFYLGQSLRDAGDWLAAIEAYERRIALGGWDEETWYALYQIAVCHQHNDSSQKSVMAAYEKANQFRPTRAEPLTMLAGYLRKHSRWQEAYSAASKAMLITYPSDVLFIDQNVYRWRAIDEYSIAAFYVGRFRESLKACQLLLDGRRIPSSEIERVQANANLARDNLNRIGQKKSLRHAGGAIGKTARFSIRRRKKPSNPGSPPHTQTGMLKRVIRYEVASNKTEVAIGPVNEIAGRIWNLHEFGGVATKRRKLKPHRFRVGEHGPIRIKQHGNKTKFARIELRTAAQANRATRLIAEENERRSDNKPRHYPKRPFMKPALDANRSRLPMFWANSVK